MQKITPFISNGKLGSPISQEKQKVKYHTAVEIIQTNPLFLNKLARTPLIFSTGKLS